MQFVSFTPEYIMFRNLKNGMFFFLAKYLNVLREIFPFQQIKHLVIFFLNHALLSSVTFLVCQSSPAIGFHTFAAAFDLKKKNAHHFTKIYIFVKIIFLTQIFHKNIFDINCYHLLVCFSFFQFNQMEKILILCSSQLNHVFTRIYMKYVRY